MAASRYSHDPDLSSASTIPADWYRDPSKLDAELDRVFARTWQLVGHTEQVRLPGDYFTCTVSEEPLVVTRGEDGVIRALSNVCRHRAGPVARGAGHRKSLMCGYHGWTTASTGGFFRPPSGTACGVSTGPPRGCPPYGWRRGDRSSSCASTRASRASPTCSGRFRMRRSTSRSST